MIVNEWLLIGMMALCFVTTLLAVLGCREAYLGWRRERCVVRCYFALSDWAEGALRRVLGQEDEVDDARRPFHDLSDDPVEDWDRMVRHHFAIMAYHGISSQLTDVDEGYVVGEYSRPGSWGSSTKYRLDRLRHS